MIRNDTLKGQRHSIPKDCRQQIRSQLFQQRENIDFDPKLKASCKNEIKELCSNVAHGAGQVNKQNASVSAFNMMGCLLKLFVCPRACGSINLCDGFETSLLFVCFLSLLGILLEVFSRDINSD